MVLLARIYYFIHDGLFGALRHLDGIAPLLFRLYLAPIMLSAGLYKWRHFDNIVSWFDDGLGFANPELMAVLIVATEVGGGFLLLFGLAVRWAAIPLMVAMAVAAVTVHWENGWFAIMPGDPQTSTAKVLADVGIPAARESLQNSAEVAARLERVEAILREHGDYEWLTEKGKFVVLNNGIEFAATYFLMLLSLFFTGGGRYLSLDDYLNRKYRRRLAEADAESEAGTASWS